MPSPLRWELGSRLDGSGPLVVRTLVRVCGGRCWCLVRSCVCCPARTKSKESDVRRSLRDAMATWVRVRVVCGVCVRARGCGVRSCGALLASSWKKPVQKGTALCLMVAVSVRVRRRLGKGTCPKHGGHGTRGSAWPPHGRRAMWGILPSRRRCVHVDATRSLKRRASLNDRRHQCAWVQWVAQGVCMRVCTEWPTLALRAGEEQRACGWPTGSTREGRSRWTSSLTGTRCEVRAQDK
jgi:hypothetical protein